MGGGPASQALLEGLQAVGWPALPLIKLQVELLVELRVEGTICILAYYYMGY